MKSLLVFIVTTLCSCHLLAMSGSPSSKSAVENIGSPVSMAAVLSHYADLALAMYGDSLATAKQLQAAVEALTKLPNEKNLSAAKSAWVTARHPYQQTEAYRFGNTIVDDWEGKVNAWPLDEGLIDYVAPSYGKESEENPLYTANIVASSGLLLAGKPVEVNRIDKVFLKGLHEAEGVETNVAVGYHAIEFLLWGQDLNGSGTGAGIRPATDYDVDNCRKTNCARRAEYLIAAAELLVDDLEWMVGQWSKGGAARSAVTTGNLESNVATIFTGMGSLSYGELAGERMRLGLMLHDPEEEHDCFSDNTHWSHYNDALGIINVYTGSYTTIEGNKIVGASLSGLVAERSPEVDRVLRNDLTKTLQAMQVLVDSAEQGESYDQLIGEGNVQGNAKVQAAIDALVKQTKAIAQAVDVMELNAIVFEGSDSLNAPQNIR